MKPLFEIVFGVGVAIFIGFVLTLLWGWFVVPMGVPALGVAQAVGLIYTINLISMAPRIYAIMKEEEAYLQLIAMAIGSSFALLLSWVAHMFMVQ